jgi:ankyrin repeat protein
LEVVKYLKEAGADVTVANNDGITPVYIASQEGHLEIVKYLTESGADVTVANNNGRTPVYIASEKVSINSNLYLHIYCL